MLSQTAASMAPDHHFCCLYLIENLNKLINDKGTLLKGGVLLEGLTTFPSICYMIALGFFDLKAAMPSEA